MRMRVPNKEEREILERNGIDPDGVSIQNRSEDTIVAVVHRSRDIIMIIKGDKPWTS